MGTAKTWLSFNYKKRGFLIAMTILFAIFLFIIINTLLGDSTCESKYNQIYNQKNKAQEDFAYDHAKIYKKYSSQCRQAWQVKFDKGDTLSKAKSIRIDLDMSYALSDAKDQHSQVVAKEALRKANKIPSKDREELGLTPLMSSLYYQAREDS